MNAIQPGNNNFINWDYNLDNLSVLQKCALGVLAFATGAFIALPIMIFLEKKQPKLFYKIQRTLHYWVRQRGSDSHLAFNGILRGKFFDRTLYSHHRLDGRFSLVYDPILRGRMISGEGTVHTWHNRELKGTFKDNNFIRGEIQEDSYQGHYEGTVIEDENTEFKPIGGYYGPDLRRSRGKVSQLFRTNPNGKKVQLIPAPTTPPTVDDATYPAEVPFNIRLIPPICGVGALTLAYLDSLGFDDAPTDFVGHLKGTLSHDRGHRQLQIEGEAVSIKKRGSFHGMVKISSNGDSYDGSIVDNRLFQGTVTLVNSDSTYQIELVNGMMKKVLKKNLDGTQAELSTSNVAYDSLRSHFVLNSLQRQLIARIRNLAPNYLASRQ